MKLNCISIAQVDFWIRVVRPTFIFISFSIQYFSIFSSSFERPFDCVRVRCATLTSCVVWPVRNKNKNFEPISVEVLFAMLLLREKKLHFHRIIMCTNNSHSLLRCRIRTGDCLESLRIFAQMFFLVLPHTSSLFHSLCPLVGVWFVIEDT